MSTSSSSDDEAAKDLARQLRRVNIGRENETMSSSEDDGVHGRKQHGDDIGIVRGHRNSVRVARAKRYPNHQPEAIQLLNKITGKTEAELKSALYKTYIVDKHKHDHREISRYVRNGQNHGFGIEVLHIIRIVRNNDFEFDSEPPPPHSSFKRKPSEIFQHKRPPLNNNPSTTLASSNPAQNVLANALGAAAAGTPQPASSSGTPRPRPYRNKNYRMLLWHGTQKQYVPSILMDGFAIPPIKNQMFGTGVYFADRSSKSAGYCGGTTAGSEGYLFLCDVKLGKIYNACKAHNDYTKAPDGFDTVKCCGKRIPDEEEPKRELQGALIPSGRTIDNSKFPNYTLI